MPKDMQRLKVPEFFLYKWLGSFNRMFDCQCILTLLDSVPFFQEGAFETPEVSQKKGCPSALSLNFNGSVANTR